MESLKRWLDNRGVQDALLFGAALGVCVAVVILLGVLAANADAGTKLDNNLDRLKVAAENHDGYDRDLFPHWSDLDHDGQDTREEELADNHAAWPNCAGYYSRYDALCWTDKSDVDVDHRVPLGEAWDSGARQWSTDEREQFANDPANLALMTDNLNQSKGDDDLAEYVPDDSRCNYVKRYVATKAKYELTVDRAEKTAMVKEVRECDAKSAGHHQDRTEPRSTTDLETLPYTGMPVWGVVGIGLFLTLVGMTVLRMTPRFRGRHRAG